MKLALSLHAPNDELRAELMPVNRRFPLRRADGGLPRATARPPRRRIFIEYLLLEGVNDSRRAGRRAGRLLLPHGRGGFHVNLIAYNPTPAGYRGLGPRRVAGVRGACSSRPGVRPPTAARTAATSTRPAASWPRATCGGAAAAQPRARAAASRG